MKLTSRKITMISLFIALSLVLSILDGLIPSFVPGMKLGLANIIILIALYVYGFWDAFYINIVRVLLAGILRGNFLSMGFFMSLTGAIFSLLIMFILKKSIKKIHIVGVSVVGSIFHSVGQILIGICYLGTGSLLYYLPILSLTSILCGIFIGLAAAGILKLKLFKNINN